MAEQVTLTSDGTVVYPRSADGGKGKCYQPTTTGLKPCAWHARSNPTLKLKSRCSHPRLARELTADDVRRMTICPMYEPDEKIVEEIRQNYPAEKGKPTGTYADAGIFASKRPAAPATSPLSAPPYQKPDPYTPINNTSGAQAFGTPGTVQHSAPLSGDMFRKAISLDDDVSVGHETLKKYPDPVYYMSRRGTDGSVVNDTDGDPVYDEYPDETLKLLIPKLGFKYQDNEDKLQGSVIDFVARAIRWNDIAVLIGHLGTGKTTAVMHVAELCNAPLVIVNCDGQLTTDQIIGTRVPAIDPNGHTFLQWRDAPLLSAFRNGLWAVIDDFTFTGSDVFSALFGLMTNTHYQVQTTGEVIPRHPSFRLFLTTNPPEFMELYPNRQQPDAAFNSRIQARFMVDFLPEDAERRALREAASMLSNEDISKLLRCAAIARRMLLAGELNFVLSTRHMVNWVKKFERRGDLKKSAWEAFVADMDKETRAVFTGKILDSQV